VGGSVHVITEKRPSRARRYVVRYRRGGRGFALEHGGSFEKKGQADERKRLIGGWLAAGLNPAAELASLTEKQIKTNLLELGRVWLRSRHDLAEKSRRVYEANLRTLAETPVGTLDPHTLTPQAISRQIAAWVDQGLAPKTIRGFVSLLRQILDFGDVEPNPARHRSVKLPSQREAEIIPPTVEEYIWLLRSLPEKYRRLLLLIEQTGMRVSEALSLEPDDVLAPKAMLRLRPTATKGRRGSRRGRWVPIEPWALDLVLEEGLPFAVTDNGLRSAIRDACEAAGRETSRFMPHKWRHRRISLWLAQGLSPAELTARTGHADQNTTLNVYSHVMPPQEATQETVEAALRDAPVMREAVS
jgi:integrase